MACVRKPISAVEIRYFIDDVSDIEIEGALHQLYNSSMLRSATDLTGNSDEPIFSLTDVAEEYLHTIRPIPKEIYQLVKSKKSELQKIIDSEYQKKMHYKYDMNAVYWSNKDERICSIYLNKAITASKRGDIEEAELQVSIAKRLMPEFSECYRIHASILKEESPPPCQDSCPIP